MARVGKRLRKQWKQSRLHKYMNFREYYTVYTIASMVDDEKQQEG